MGLYMFVSGYVSLGLPKVSCIDNDKLLYKTEARFMFTQILYHQDLCKLKTSDGPIMPTDIHCLNT